MLHKLCLLAAIVTAPLGAAGNYRLLPLPEGPCTAPAGCIPVILIHGIHGTAPDGSCTLDANPAADCNWSALLHWLAEHNPDLWSRLRIYLFRYLSDEGDPVTEIGRQLWLAADLERPNWDRPGIVIAQSMGGLVARAFLAHQPQPFLPPGRALIALTITLASPHHGTPLANRLPRNRLAGASAFSLDLFDILYWSASGSGDLAANPNLPNRADLLWDNYDGLFPAPAGETNTTLQQLAAAEDDGARMIVYGGYVQSDASELLRTSAALLTDPLAKPWNDGLVPIDSALFQDNPKVLARRVFPGNDHQDMMGYTARSQTLLQTLTQDLAAAAGLPPPRSPRTR